MCLSTRVHADRKAGGRGGRRGERRAYIHVEACQHRYSSEVQVEHCSPCAPRPAVSRRANGELLVVLPDILALPINKHCCVIPELVVRVADFMVHRVVVVFRDGVSASCEVHAVLLCDRRERCDVRLHRLRRVAEKVLWEQRDVALLRTRNFQICMRE